MDSSVAMSSSKDLGVLVVTLNCSSHQKNYSFITRWIHLLKNGPFPATFFLIFVFSTQLTENKCSIKVCRWLDLNRGSLVSEATALPAKPQPLPKLSSGIDQLASDQPDGSQFLISHLNKMLQALCQCR